MPQFLGAIAAAKSTESEYGLGNDRLPDAYSCYDLR
jgi:hypothetical protein